MENNSQVQAESVIKTICRDCVFKASTDTGYQTGCILSKLENLSANGAILERENNYYTILERYCNFCRNDDWLTNTKSFTMQKATEKVNNEVSSKLIDIAIILENNKLHKLIDTLDSIKSQNLMPAKVIVSTASNVWPKTVTEIMKKIREYHFPLWNVVTNMQEKHPFTGELYGHNHWMNTAQKNSNSLFCGFFDAGYKIPSNFISIINDIVNEQMKQVIMIKPIENNNGLVIHNKFYSMAGGSGEQNIVDKVEICAKNQDRTHMILEPENTNGTT